MIKDNNDSSLAYKLIFSLVIGIFWEIKVMTLNVKLDPMTTYVFCLTDAVETTEELMVLLVLLNRSS